jgi:ribonucleoside-diphosphate reductase alpha chain
MTSGSYPDDGLGEVFLKLGKQGSTLAGVMDAFSIAVSIGLQYGVPLETFVQKFTNLEVRAGRSDRRPDIRMSQSIMDYIFRRLALDYLSFDERAELGIYTATERARHVETGSVPAERGGRGLSEARVVEERRRRRGRHRRAHQLDEPVPTSDRPRRRPRTTSELFESITGTSVDAPLCLTCGTKMRPVVAATSAKAAGSTSGCS